MIEWEGLSSVQHPQSEWYTYDPIPQHLPGLVPDLICHTNGLGAVVDGLSIQGHQAGSSWWESRQQNEERVRFELLTGDARSQTEKREKQPRNGSQAQ